MIQTNMTTADRLAMKLKTSPMNDFFTEDDLLEICKMAIEKAFFTGREGGYNQPYQNAEIVDIAKDAMTAKVKEYVDEKFSQIVNDEKFQDQMGNLMVSTLGAVLIESLKENWQRQFFQNISTHGSLISQIVKNHT